MFENYVRKLQNVVKNLRGEGRLNPGSISKKRVEIRIALSKPSQLQVVKQFTDAVSAKGSWSGVLQSLTPDRQVVKLVARRTGEILAEGNVQVNFSFAAAHRW